MADIRLSFSRLDTINTCGERFRLRYVEKVPGQPSGFFAGGKAVHKTLEWVQKQDLWEPRSGWDREGEVWLYFQDALTEAIADAVKWAPGLPFLWGGREHGENEPWWRNQGPVMLRNAAASYDAWVGMGWSIIRGGTEMQVSMNLPQSGTLVTGYLDTWIAEDDTKESVIVDWKTGQVGRSEPMQFATYAKAIMVAGLGYVTRGLAVYLRASAAAKRFQHYDLMDLIPLVDDQYESIVRTIVAGQDREHEPGAYGYKPSFLCKTCGVRRECLMWQATGAKQEAEEEEMAHAS